jgi:hypothetical protein
VITPFLDPVPWLAGMAALVVGTSPAAAAQDGKICGVVMASERCGANAPQACPETSTRLPQWRLRVARLGSPSSDTVVTSAADGSFTATVPAGDYRVSSAESTLAGLSEPAVVKVGEGECVHVELNVQLLRP